MVTSSRGGSDRAGVVYAKLHDLIVRGVLAPGARLTEADVSGRLGVSRTPVREAIQRLQYEGYVTAPHAGRRALPSVSPLTLPDGRDLMRIIGALEGLAAHDAAQLERKKRLKLVDRLRGTNRYLRAAAAARNPQSSLLYDLDQEFHRTFVEAAAGPRLLQLHRAIKPHAQRYGRVYLQTLAGRIRHSLREHDAIARAIAAGRADAAERAVLTNWRNGAASLSQVMESVGERGLW